MASTIIQFNKPQDTLTAEQLRRDPFMLSLMEVIKDGLIQDEYVRLHQFGTFRLKWTKPTRRRLPNGNLVAVPSQPRVTFSPAKYLRELIEPNPPAMQPLQDNVVTMPLPNRQVADQQAQPKNNSQENQEQENRPAVQEVKPAAPVEKTRKNTYLLPASLVVAIPLLIGLLNSQLSSELTAPQLEPQQVIAIQSQPATTNNSAIKQQAVKSAATPPRPKVQLYVEPHIYTIQGGDSLWKLAKTILGDPHLWPYIYRANQRSLTNPDKLVVGQNLVIPGLRQAVTNLHPEDSRMIAEGYSLLYEYYKKLNHPHAEHYLVGVRRFSRLAD